MDPAITLPALHHFAITVIVIIALITEWAEVAWEKKNMDYIVCNRLFSDSLETYNKHPGCTALTFS